MRLFTYLLLYSDYGGGKVSTINQNLEIIRINKENYDKFCKLIEWRRTGEKSEDISYYKDDKTKNFFDKYGVLNSDTFFIFAVEFNNEFIGYINAVLIPKPDPRLGILYIDELWTAPPYRNYGIATILMNEALELAKNLDLWKVRLYVGADNLVARSFYRKAGFKETSDDRCCEININEIK